MTTAPLGPTARTGNTAFATSIALLLLRLLLGYAFIFHGSQKLFGAFGGHGMDAFIASLAKSGLPAFLPPIAWAYLAACGEFFGGISILLGLLARLGAIPLIVTMLVAIATVTGNNGFAGFTDQKGLHPGYEYNLALIAISLAILIAGPGLLSLDALLFKRGFWARGPQPLSNPIKRPIV